MGGRRGTVWRDTQNLAYRVDSRGENLLQGLTEHVLEIGQIVDRQTRDILMHAV